MNHEDKMKVLAALDMLHEKVGDGLTAPEIQIYEDALRVIGPID